MKPNFSEDYPVPIRPGNVCLCHIDIYKLKEHDVVVCTELECNEGMSITNAAERVASRVLSDQGMNPDRLIWIEHYPYSGDDETWDSCKFEWKENIASNPEWFPLGYKPDLSGDLSWLVPPDRKKIIQVLNELLPEVIG